MWPWLVLAGLGAFHGVNPAMGWLFAVGLGMQHRDRGAVVRALGPIAAGHALSIAGIVTLYAAAEALVDPLVLRRVSAGVLVGFGGWRLVRRRHPKWVGMRVGARDLALWSFLMATAHGAGLMLLPALAGLPAGRVPEPHVPAEGLAGSPWLAAGAVGLHTVAMLVVTGIVAVVVYERVALSVLRRAWVDLDLLWAAALVGVGAVMLLLENGP